MLIRRVVSHCEFGDGVIVSVYPNGNIKVDFHGEQKAFGVPAAFLQGTLKTEDKTVQEYVDTCAAKMTGKLNCLSIEKNIKRAFVFCNLMWSDWYDDPDGRGTNGGSYVAKTGSGNENMNFLPIEIQYNGEPKSMMLGSFETKTTGSRQNSTHIERIHGCDAMRNYEFVNGVTVIWCATPPQGGCSVVGWYNNATVYRDYQTIPIEDSNGKLLWERWYNVSCDAKDAVLLPVKERLSNDKWLVPRKPRDPFGFGQANIWYASEPEACEFVDRMLSNIEKYTSKNRS